MRSTLVLTIFHILLHIRISLARHDNHNYLAHHYQHYHQYQTHEPQTDLSIWISEQQVKLLSGYSLRIFAIENGRVSHFLRDPAFDSYLPMIPPEVSYVNFTWTAGQKKYRYHFDHLSSLNEEILQPPIISIKPKGKIPQEPKQFSVMLPCSNLTSGITKFSLGLLIMKGRGKLLPGTPLRFTLRKECSHRGPDPECDKKCLNNGYCTKNKICKCTEGYLGRNCEQALCFPQCLNGGNCTAPAVCSCPKGFQGRYCEGGICAEKCLNGGKCIQKDTCQCPKGYYGLRCQLSKCVVPCQNGGKCKGNNICKCSEGWYGDHCEIRRLQRSVCPKPCKNGSCLPNATCKCKKGWSGKFCNTRNKRRRNTSKLPRR